MINSATLPFLLKQLHLKNINSSWEEMAQQAEKSSWSYPQYLTALCDKEVSVRVQQRIQENIRNAKFPTGKTLDTFEFGKLTSVKPAQIIALAENTNWVTQGHNLIIFGPSGVGKTHIAAAIGRRLVEHGMRVLFTKTTVLVQTLQLASNQHKLSELLVRLSKFQLLILDDIGYVKKNESETNALFELISDRYESRSLLITSNQGFDQWDTIFSNNAMAVAATDRLVHHSTIININEASYRRTSKLQEANSLLPFDENKKHTILR
jgi:DNA replication protein DnaC